MEFRYLFGDNRGCCEEANASLAAMNRSSGAGCAPDRNDVIWLETAGHADLADLRRHAPGRDLEGDDVATLEQMRSRQKVLADFGDFALRSESLDDVLHEACRLVSEALDADLAKILEIEESGEAALIRAGTGWSPGVVGTRLRFSARSSETYSLKLGAPVISQDIRKEERFDFAEFLVEHGAVSLVNSPIFLPGGKPYGLLQVDSRAQRDFGDEDVEFLRTYTTILGPVIDRLHKVHSLEQALETNKRLLRELQHRVKNHVGMIMGIVWIRARQVKSDEAREELKGVGERIETLRMVHEQLYEAGSVDRLPMRPFLSRLIANICDLHEAEAGRIKLEIDIADVDLGPEGAVPLGLISNEFVTNSLKYAFGGKGGKISVTLRDAGDRLHFCLHDDGKGLPAEPQVAPLGTGTGIKLIEGLAHQLGAEAVWPETERGTMLRLDFAKAEE